MTVQNQAVVESLRVPVWAYVAAALAMFALYLLTMENGAVFATGAETVHELFHDARHFVGVPCH